MSAQDSLSFFFVSCTLLLRYKRCIVIGGLSVRSNLGLILFAGKSYGAAFCVARDITMHISHFVIKILRPDDTYEQMDMEVANMLSRANVSGSNGGDSDVGKGKAAALRRVHA
jgi:hypothetical protein